MFLSRRVTQAEYFDSPDRAQAEVAEFYEALARVNRLFVFGEPFQRLLPKCLGPDACRNLSLLDLGAGDGSLGALLTDWAAAGRGWQWRFTNLDLSLPALRLGKPGRRVAGSALALPFRDASIDVVIASQMTHHLANDEEIVRHLREAWRVARRVVLLADLHRGPLLYGVLWLLVHVRRYPKHFCHDALLSVRRGFRVGELRRLAAAAGLGNARVWLYYGGRVLLQAGKSL